jgi:Icc-related predicted phosphoesterase
MAELLLFSDVHSNVSACRRLVDRAAEVDVVVGAGDFCQMRRGLDHTISILSEIETPTVLVPGNSESVEELRAECADWPSAHVLHGEGATLDGVSFYGLGGGVPVTPFGDWSYDFTEEEAEDLLSDFDAHDVLVSHSPPNGVVDRDSHDQSLGSTAVRAAIEAHEPALVVCGHIHDSWGQEETLGSTRVINAGPNGRVETI